MQHRCPSDEPCHPPHELAVCRPEAAVRLLRLSFRCCCPSIVVSELYRAPSLLMLEIPFAPPLLMPVNHRAAPPLPLHLISASVVHLPFLRSAAARALELSCSASVDRPHEPSTHAWKLLDFASAHASEPLLLHLCHHAWGLPLLPPLPFSRINPLLMPENLHPYHHAWAPLLLPMLRAPSPFHS